jgi:pseudouridine-5'-phosphate glycosidase
MRSKGEWVVLEYNAVMRANSILVDAGVKRALSRSAPVVALESTVITHGLPAPQNLGLARRMEAEVRAAGAVPATIALLDGAIRVGLSQADLERLAKLSAPMKLGRRELAAAVTKGWSGGTTVAATMQIASAAGIRILATGGIGGVHREDPTDVSGDLPALAEIPMLVVSAGIKAILDLPATLEKLETFSVPIVGYQTDEFPAFYCRGSGRAVTLRLDSPGEVAAFARSHWRLGNRSGILIANPIPGADEIPQAVIEPILSQASEAARQQGVHGPGLTPFLLERVRQATKGRSVEANLALLLNNATVAAQIAAAMVKARSRTV